MSGRLFFDTNVLVYAFTADDARNDDAEQLLAMGGIVSVQVLNEFVNVSRAKHRRSWDEVDRTLDIIRTILDPPLPLTMAVHAKAVEIARRYRFKFYDSLIVAAALSADCSLLLTEDLQDGQKIENMIVRNPFRTQ